MKAIFYFFLIVIACSCKSKSIDTYNDIVALMDNDSIGVLIEKRNAKRIAYNDSINAIMQWEEVRDGLFISQYGDLGFESFQLLDPKDYSGFTYYQTVFCNEDRTPLNQIVDAETFKHIAGGGFGAYYKDKNHIYHTFGTSGGNNFSLLEKADYATFRIIDDCYGVDKNHVYDMRDGMREDIDVKTFKILEINNRCYAKDRNGYYESTDKLTDEQLKDPEMQEIVERLDKL